MIYPDTFEAKIGFAEIRTRLRSFCLCTLGTERVDDMAFMTDHKAVSSAQRDTHEMCALLEGDEEFPARDFFDMRPMLRAIRPHGTYMEVRQMWELGRSLQAVINVVRFLQETPLSHLCEEVDTFPLIVRRTEQILDPFGQVRDTASPELADIRHQLAAAEGSVGRTLRSILRAAKEEGIAAADAEPAMRDGRLVIPVSPAMKRKLRGIVHDESATGKTVFIEPAEVVEANNRIRELEAEERREIIRILHAFSDEVRPLAPQMLNSYEFLADVDFLYAKARFAKTEKCVAPQPKPYPLIDWTLAVHPILRSTLAVHGKKAVPLDVELTREKRILVISGPNAGGKSVCLKTVALLQYMLQCGLPIPVGENSRTGMFRSVFIDIGDEQSIENELSTYSSHLYNMKMMMRSCDDASLLLIDEFGGGTEPQIGAAMAEAMLMRFVQRRAFGIITTHYQNLKHFADAHEGVVNGAMLYDRAQMQPLFTLEIGRPGSSFAVEIARKIGIPGDVIDDAANIVGQDYINADKYLQDIVRDKRYYEAKRQTIHGQEKQLQAEIEKLQAEMEKLKAQRRDILAKAKQEAQEILAASNARVEATIKEIREAQAERSATQEARRELEQFKQEVKELEDDGAIDRKIEQLKARQERKKNKKKQPPLNPPEGGNKPLPLGGAGGGLLVAGSTVRIKGQTTVGTIESIAGKKALIVFGTMRTTVALDRLEHAKPETIQTPRPIGEGLGVGLMHNRRLDFKQDIDLRGMRVDEALNQVMYFIDDAAMLGIGRVRILHGTGTGALRQAIRDYLHASPVVAHYQDEHVQFGGAGITVVELR